jgi:23S rRNA (adenine2030-N6)-methyltransferase
LLDDYRAAIQAVNAEAEPQFYPGSPTFLAQLLRPQDS